MEKVLPKVYEAYETYYKGCTIRRLCQEMHNFYKERNVASLQQQLFTQDHLPPYAMSPRKAEGEYFRGNGELIDLKDAEGRIALEGALPYPRASSASTPENAGPKPPSTTSWTS